MTPACLNVVLTRFLGGVSLTMRLEVSILFAMTKLVGGGHFNRKKIVAKVLQCGLYWPALFKDAHLYCKSYPRCLQFGKISRRDVMPLNPIIIVEIFGV